MKKENTELLGVRRDYKDTIFRRLFSEKEALLSLYNAILGANYTNVDELEIVTLENAVYMNMRNDVAFVVDCSLNLYEHQSTYNPNMPLRNLFYVSKELSMLVDAKTLYRRSLVKIPVPKFVVFYNGDEEQPETYDMKLSDAFEKKTENLELELVCKVYNINFGKNKQLLEKCKVLREYMIFVDYVRYYHKEQEYDDLAAAINRAIDRCIEEGVLADFLRENRSEVVKVTQLDYTFDKQIMLEREDAREEGRAMGLAEGRQEGRAEGRQEGSTKKAKMIAHTKADFVAAECSACRMQLSNALHQENIAIPFKHPLELIAQVIKNTKTAKQ